MWYASNIVLRRELIQSRYARRLPVSITVRSISEVLVILVAMWEIASVELDVMDISIYILLVLS